MCLHIKLSIFRNIFLKIEKVVITFSILEKIFSKIENLMYVLRTHIIKIHISNQFKNKIKVHVDKRTVMLLT